jgi:tRNA U55 pseudouridine synthase TruB
LVRAGQEVTLAARTVEIFELTFQALAKDRIGFKVRCSSGTYIRAIARDLGEMLGCGGALESLRREELPPFSVAEAHTLAEIETSHILSVERIFCTDSPSSGVRASVELPAEIVVKLRVGNIPEKIISMLSMYAKADALVLYREHARQEALGVLEFHEQQWRIFCNFG